MASHVHRTHRSGWMRAGLHSASEVAELRDIYIGRGLDPELAAQVSQQLMTHDALGAHARDDIGITEALTARPLQAALVSSISFALGGIAPLISDILFPREASLVIAVVSL